MAHFTPICRFLLAPRENATSFGHIDLGPLHHPPLLCITSREQVLHAIRIGSLTPPSVGAPLLAHALIPSELESSSMLLCDWTHSAASVRGVLLFSREDPRSFQGCGARFSISFFLSVRPPLSAITLAYFILALGASQTYSPNVVGIAYVILDHGVYGILLYDDSLDDMYSSVSHSFAVEHPDLWESPEFEGPVCAWPWFDNMSMTPDVVNECRTWAK
ncbi:uncharacterized protein STEHIDRAFT_160035 [Stereum hirsutum FP-91666 SS1]|uniref:uncharacterized protein n=1 Tax=Stereum hirsutum (strain FP-91666) TaxID=721885 RepID=UPI0004449593|nr:uncharacterized protein STEHIDRAFT_160035 [Stereum hirsutum FP-91666 SS1]EIM83452.1 hypothetical protein STEHIDRAFT_160035 [Stereum hirsutum FP-91666 SS1]